MSKVSRRTRLVPCCGLGILGIAVGVGLLPVPAPAGQGQGGLDVFRSNCDGCHDLPDPEKPKRNRAEWEAVLNKMVKEKGATLTKQEFGAVLNYLDSFNQARREVTWNDQPAASHRVTFDEKLAGQVPDLWVNLAPGSQVDPAWVVKKDAAARTCYVAPKTTVPETQQQLLLDNSGLVQNAVLTTRLRIQAGPGATGAGIVFGYRSAQSYFGVRLSSTSKNVVLYDVDASQRAMLGRAGAAVAAGQWITLGVAVSGNQVQVTIDGKPVLARPLTSYRGGRVGLATDGATLAGFDQWAVEVKT